MNSTDTLNESNNDDYFKINTTLSKSHDNMQDISIDVIDNNSPFNYNRISSFGNLNFELVRNRLDSINENNNLINFYNDIAECADIYIKSNSPISMSPCSSVSDIQEYIINEQMIHSDPINISIDSQFNAKSKKIINRTDINDDDKSSEEQNHHGENNNNNIKIINNKKMKDGLQFSTYEEIEKSISKYYNTDNNYYNELDILITYLRGQKNVYIQSKNITQYKLNLLIIPSLVLTTTITIFSPIIYNNSHAFKWGGVIISILNAIATLFISFSNYFKYESLSEGYLNIANQYDKLETSIELTTNKLYFIDKHMDQTDLILNRLKHVETKLNELKESSSSNMLVPEYVKTLFPIITHVNIFSFINKTENYKKHLIIQFRDIKNEIKYIEYKWKNKGLNIFVEDSLETATRAKERKRFQYLIKIKEKTKKELIYYKSTYGFIDEIFTREIKNAESILNSWIGCFKLFFFGPKKPLYKYDNVVINEYLKQIFMDE
jgi:hypothetical protein